MDPTAGQPLPTFDSLLSKRHQRGGDDDGHRLGMATRFRCIGATANAISVCARVRRARWQKPCGAAISTPSRTVSWLSDCRRLHRRYERMPEHFPDTGTSIWCRVWEWRPAPPAPLVHERPGPPDAGRGAAARSAKPTESTSFGTLAPWLRREPASNLPALRGVPSTAERRPVPGVQAGAPGIPLGRLRRRDRGRPGRCSGRGPRSLRAGPSRGPAGPVDGRSPGERTRAPAIAADREAVTAGVARGVDSRWAWGLCRSRSTDLTHPLGN